jgi:hypothetical protein
MIIVTPARGPGHRSPLRPGSVPFQVALRGLYRCVAEQQLDLLEVASGLPAQLGAGPPEVVRREFPQRRRPDIFEHHLPDGLLVGDCFARYALSRALGNLSASFVGGQSHGPGISQICRRYAATARLFPTHFPSREEERQQGGTSVKAKPAFADR